MGLNPFRSKEVASFTDAWIETLEDAENLEKEKVASFTDAWIETCSYRLTDGRIESHLLQMRGLKHDADWSNEHLLCRIFYRCVD